MASLLGGVADHELSSLALSSFHKAYRSARSTSPIVHTACCPFLTRSLAKPVGVEFVGIAEVAFAF